MFVGERMSKPVVTISPETTINEAFDLLRKKEIQRLPVLSKDGKLIGIVSDHDLINASPSPATTLSIWEMNYLLAKIKVEDVMTKKVITVDISTPIEQAARIMADNKIGGMPVMDGDQVVGVITDTDLFKIFLELMGGRTEGVRVTAIVPDVKGELAALTMAISKAGGNFISFGQFDSEIENHKELTFKVADVSIEDLEEVLLPHVTKIKDIRLN